MLSEEDIAFIENLSVKVLLEYRNTIFSASYLQANPALPPNHGWVQDIKQLKQFVEQQAALASTSIYTQSSSVDLTQPVIKAEDDACSLPRVKAEEKAVTISNLPSSGECRIRSYMENGQDVIEILDSDEEQDPPSLLPSHVASALTMQKKIRPSPQPPMWSPSDTVWLDDGITSEVCTSHQQHRLTNKSTVQRLERLTTIPSIWPVRQSTAFLVEYGEKYGVSETRKIDSLVLDRDNDSWQSRTEASERDSSPLVTPWPGAEAVRCRSARHTCQGVWACRDIDEEVLSTPRRELDKRAGIFFLQVYGRHVRKRDQHPLVLQQRKLAEL
ncbi:hypothetical protein AAF712_016741 [Marasmius tenuissimus]|uniref:Uncharacterized protein n=1 Tax=Marasmius tenuissimus TaxID=585030 RepID=A0ABR2Z843_9AGAR